MKKNNPVLKIEKNHPMPRGRRALSGNLYALRLAIGKLKKDESFLWPGRVSSPFLAAKQIGAKITTLKIDGKGFRIWKIQPTEPSKG